MALSWNLCISLIHFWSRGRIWLFELTQAIRVIICREMEWSISLHSTTWLPTIWSDLRDQTTARLDLISLPAFNVARCYVHLPQPCGKPGVWRDRRNTARCACQLCGATTRRGDNTRIITVRGTATKADATYHILHVCSVNVPLRRSQLYLWNANTRELRFQPNITAVSIVGKKDRIMQDWCTHNV